MQTAWSALTGGFTVRPARYLDRGDGTSAVDPVDLAAVASLMRDCDVAVVGEPDSGPDEVASMFSGPTTDREATVLVLDADEVVGFVWIERDSSAAESWVDVYVHPTRADPALVDAALEHGRLTALAHRAAAGEGATWHLRSGCFSTDPTLVPALEKHGFERVRRFWRMRIDLTLPSAPASSPVLPDGVTVSVVRTESERRRTHQIRNASFEDHWHNVERPFAEWVAFFPENLADPEGWWLLQVDGVDAGICILDESRADSGDGYVRTLGVVPEFRGRGFGTLLLARSFAYYRGRGRSGVQLDVDSANATGATRLYEKAGMRPHRVIDAWSSTLPDA
jgi:ribosomal protein S18 acetylase RimI-like enzyme